MPYPPGVFKEAEKALFLKVMDIKYWMMLGHEVILKLMEQKFSTKINIDINFSVLDIDTEHENIKTGQYLCMLDVEDFIWITYYKNKYAKGDKMKGSFWTFKHKPGLGADADACAAQVDAALRNNCCMMQQEYVLQDSKSVTRSWNLAKKLNKGDIVFLRGDNRIYAVGEIIVPRGIEENEDAPCLKMQDITSTRSHGEDNQYRSDNFSGMIFFDDSDVFYEELEGKNGWGQRVDVDSWKYYCEDGIPISDSDFIKEDQYSIIRKMKPEIGIKLMEELKMASLSTPALLLHNQLNLILTGAPGTGKTYYAKKIAAELIGVNMAEETWQDMLANHPQYKFVQFHPGYDYSDFVEGLKPKLAGGMISFERKPGIFMEFCAAAAKDIDAPHVFVIDEINRADLSRVFGELFFGLEEDYRGNPISTQYSYLNDGQAFIIPSNAYIIGTMNDIDRSVESMDFALRRRFAWYEVTAEETAESILDKLSPTTKDKCMAAMNNLNKHIGSTFGDEYKLGAAYFKKIEKYGDDFSKLWKYHISIILADYLRGRKDRKDQFEKLGRIFSEAITDGTVPQGQAMP